MATNGGLGARVRDPEQGLRQAGVWVTFPCWQAHAGAAAHGAAHRGQHGAGLWWADLDAVKFQGQGVGVRPLKDIGGRRVGAEQGVPVEQIGGTQHGVIRAGEAVGHHEGKPAVAPAGGRHGGQGQRIDGDGEALGGAQDGPAVLRRGQGDGIGGAGAADPGPPTEGGIRAIDGCRCARRPGRLTG